MNLNVIIPVHIRMPRVQNLAANSNNNGNLQAHVTWNIPSRFFGAAPIRCLARLSLARITACVPARYSATEWLHAKAAMYYGAGGSTVATASTIAEELIALAHASEPAAAAK